MTRILLTVAAAAALCSTALAQTRIDGRVLEPTYGNPLVVQDTATGFGDSNLGRPDVANGSELDGAYGYINGGVLYLALTGNLESNGNQLEIFIDSRAGGQNRLRYENPGSPGADLLRMSASDSSNTDGLRFTPGFNADFWISVEVFGDPATIYAEYAELWVDAGNPGVYYYLGQAFTTCVNADGTLTGGDSGAPAIRVNVDNRNVLGVPGTDLVGGDDPALVKTGVELAIPLSAIGNPAGPVNLTVFINGQQHDFVSNQFLWGLFGVTANLGEPRNVDLGTTAHMPFAVPVINNLLGACCIGTNCSITTQAGCSGTWLGANTTCDANPCNAVPDGRCCIDDGFSGTCRVTEQALCTQLGGTWTAGQNCEGCPCLIDPKGACCVGTTCSVVTEAACTAASGSYLGNYTNCNNTPCAEGACCTGVDCAVTREFECTGLSSYLGAGTTCVGNPCAEPSFPAPYIAGGFQGWNPTSTPMVNAGGGKWTYTVTGQAPGARVEFKITNGLDWSAPGHKNFPGANSWAYCDENGSVTITYDSNYYNDGWSPYRDRLGLDVPVGEWGVPGNHGSEFGGSDWANGSPAILLDPTGDPHVYSKSFTNIPPANYEFKFTKFGTWDSISWDARSVGTANWAYSIADATEVITFTVDNFHGRVKYEIVATPTGCPGDSNCDGAIDFDDIDFFVAALSGEQAWIDLHIATFGQAPTCPYSNNDVDGIGGVTFDDIDPFVAVIGSSCP